MGVRKKINTTAIDKNLRRVMIAYVLKLVVKFNNNFAIKSFVKSKVSIEILLIMVILNQ